MLSKSENVRTLANEAVRHVALRIDDPDLLDHIAALLAGEPAVIVLDQDEPDVVIVDRLPVCRDRPTIILDDRLRALDGLKAGASGVLPRTCHAGDLRLAIEAAARGLIVIAREFAQSDLSDGGAGVSGASHPLQRENLLTPRELEVLRLLAEGASNKLIARALGVSIHTAKFHVASIATKLDATGRTDAVAQAVRLGLIML